MALAVVAAGFQVHLAAEDLVVVVCIESRLRLRGRRQMALSPDGAGEGVALRLQEAVQVRTRRGNDLRPTARVARLLLVVDPPLSSDAQCLHRHT